MMTFAGHDAGPRGTAIENDFLSTLSVMRSRHLSGNQALTRCAFIATNPEALLPHSIASTPPLGANLLTPNRSDEVPGSGDQSLGAWTANMFAIGCFQRWSARSKRLPSRLAGRRAITIRWWIEDRDSWNQRPCSKSRRAVPPADGICIPVTMT